MNWTLSPTEQAILKQDCERSGVQTHITKDNTDAIVAILKKGVAR